MFMRTLVAVAVVAMTLPYNVASAAATGWTCSTAGTSLSDCSFESIQFQNPDQYNWGNYQYAPSGTPWTFFDQFGHAGIAASHSAYTWNYPVVPDGNNVGFIQDWGSISQNISGFQDGSYTLSFQAANRAGYQPSVLEVRLDGVPLGDVLLAQNAYAGYSVTFTTSAGTHQITFAGHAVGNGADVTSLIDEVSLSATPPANDCTNTGGTTLSQCTFLTPTVAPGAWTDRYFLGSAWSFSSAGLASNTSDRTPNAPDGLAQVAFIHNQGAISQTVDGFTAATYALSFKAANRAGYQPQAVELQLDGSQVLGSWTPDPAPVYNTYTVSFDATAGKHSIAFLGLNGANGGDATGFITEVSLVLKTQPPKATALAYTGGTSFNAGAPASLAAQLLDDKNLPVAGESLSFDLNGQPCTATTDASGNAACSIAAVDQVAGLNDVPVTVTFSGDKGYLASTVTANVSVFHTTALQYTGPASADFHDGFTASAFVWDNSYGGSTQNGVSGMPVTFQLGSAGCSTLSQPGGVASCSLTPVDGAGWYWLTVTAADSGAWLGSNGSASFLIGKEESVLTFAPPATALAGGVPVSATLTEDGQTPISGAWVSFSIGGASCTAATSPSGVAACSIDASSQPLGPSTVTAYFGGDGKYKPALTSGSVLLYAFPSSGMFVIGDEANPTEVRFYDAQWATYNPMSGGPGPKNFKGFADAWNGGSFTAHPGGSVTPPQSVPSYVGVIVTGKVTDANGTISGNVERIAIVHVNLYIATVGGSGHGSLVS